LSPNQCRGEISPADTHDTTDRIYRYLVGESLYEACKIRSAIEAQLDINQDVRFGRPEARVCPWIGAKRNDSIKAVSAKVVV